MTTITYSPALDIRNTESLPKGFGCRYLEAMTAHIPGVLIAMRWRRRPPATLEDGRVLIDFFPSTEGA